MCCCFFHPSHNDLLTSGFSHPNQHGLLTSPRFCCCCFLFVLFFLTPTNTACSPHLGFFLTPAKNGLLTSGFSHPNQQGLLTSPRVFCCCCCCCCCCFLTPTNTACSPHLGFFLTPAKNGLLTSGFSHPNQQGLLTSPRCCCLLFFPTPAKTARSPRVSVTQPTRPAHLTSGFFSPQPTRPAHLGFADIGGRHAGVGAGIETQRLGFEPADGGVGVVEHATAEANRLPLLHRHVLRTLHLQGPNPH